MYIGRQTMDPFPRRFEKYFTKFKCSLTERGNPVQLKRLAETTGLQNFRTYETLHGIKLLMSREELNSRHAVKATRCGDVISDYKYNLKSKVL